jgi:hypothetical protein
MHKLLEVQETEKLMNQAKDWVAFRWLFEKPRVCQTADRVNGALDRCRVTSFAVSVITPAGLPEELDWACSNKQSVGAEYTVD